MMLVWFVFYMITALFGSRWGEFVSIVGCTVPMLAFGKAVRGETFGTRECNTVKYKKKEYVLWFAVCICGCALIFAATFLVLKTLGFAAAESSSRSDFFYIFVFSCIIPAFFEEWLMRGGVLGALAPHGIHGVVFCSLLFMLMHVDPSRWLYALFAGLMITVLVYLTECVYLGMLLHFANNLTSLLLSYLPSSVCEYVALAILAVLLAFSLHMLKKGKLFADAVKLFSDFDFEKLRKLFTPLFWIFVAAVAALILV